MSKGGIAAITSVGQGYFANKSKQAGERGYNDAFGSLASSEDKALNFLDPYRETGQLGLAPLSGLLTGQQYDQKTGKTKTLTPEERDALLYQSPGYRFATQQGQQAVERSQAAKGGLLSGGAMKELGSYLSGVASQYSDNYLNQLAGLVGIGQDAATNSANVVQGFAADKASTLANKGLVRGNYYNQLGNFVGATGGAYMQDNAQIQQAGMSALGGGGGVSSLLV